MEEHGGHGEVEPDRVDALVAQLVMANDRGWMEEVGVCTGKGLNSGGADCKGLWVFSIGKLKAWRPE